jgi:hypothetical protein
MLFTLSLEFRETEGDGFLDLLGGVRSRYFLKK